MRQNGFRIILFFLLAATSIFCSGIALAEITIEPCPIDFGNVFVGAINTVPVTVTNTGSSDLDLQAAGTNGVDQSEFTLDITTPITIHPSESIVVSVTFIPVSEGQKAAELYIFTSESPADPVLCALQGSAAAVTSLNPGAYAITGTSWQQDHTVVPTRTDGVFSGPAFSGTTVSLMTSQTFVGDRVDEPTGITHQDMRAEYDVTGTFDFGGTAYPFTGTAVVSATSSWDTTSGIYTGLWSDFTVTATGTIGEATGENHFCEITYTGRETSFVAGLPGQGPTSNSGVILGGAFVIHPNVSFREYSQIGFGEIGDSWTFANVYPSGVDDFTVSLTQIAEGEHSGRLRLGDFIMGAATWWWIFERGDDAIYAYEDLSGIPSDPPVAYPGVVPMETMVDHPNPTFNTKWYFQKIDSRATTAGTFSDILVLFTLNPSYPPNAANTAMGLDPTKVPYGVNVITWFARGVGEVMRAFKDPATGSDTYRWELDQTSLAVFSLTGSLAYSGEQAGNVVVQLFDNPDFTGSPVAATTLSTGWDYSFENLSMGTYFLRAFVDVNANGQWDPGEALGSYETGSVQVPSGSAAFDFSLDDTANFAASVTSGFTPLTVQFTDLTSGTQTSWAWDFNNDGVVDSTEQNPSWTYTTEGVYTVSMTASNGLNDYTETKADYITVYHFDGTEDFENGLNGWTVSNGVWEVGTPTAGPAAAHGGTQCAGTVLNGNYPLQDDSRLVSPAVDLPSVVEGERIELRFWHWFDYDGGDGDDKGYVQVSVWNGSAWGGWSTLATPVDAHEGNPVERTYNSGWSRCAVELTPYAGQRVRLAFYHVASSQDSYDRSRSGWYIDDVEVWHGVPQMPVLEGFENGWGDWHADQGVWQIGAPSSGGTRGGANVAATNLYGYYPDQTDSRLVSPSFELPTISGAEHIELRFWHWFDYDGGDGEDKGYVQVSVWNGSAWGGWSTLAIPIDAHEGHPSERTYNSGWSRCAVELTPYAGQRVRLAFYHVASSGDDYDNSRSGWYIDDVEVWHGVPQMPVLEGFENGWGDWHADQGVWQIGAPSSGGTHGGTNVAATNLFGYYPDQTDSRLISPSFELSTISGDEHIELRFWHWFDYDGGDGDDKGRVQVSVWNGSAWGGWSTLAIPIDAHEGHPSERTYNSGWSRCAVELTPYAGQQVRLSFYHVASSGDDFDNSRSGWYIDDVELWHGVPQMPEFEGFENGWGDWHADQGVWQVGAPSSGGTHGGTNVAATNLYGYYPDQTDSRLISPSFELPTISGDEHIELRFWHWFDYDGGDGDDKGRVQVSVWNGSAWGGWSTLAIPIDAHEGHPSERTYNSGWSRCAVGLTSYAGQRVRLAFYHVASSQDSYDNSRSGWYIDDVEVWHGVPQMNSFEGFEGGWGDWHASNGVWQIGAPSSGGVHGGSNVAATHLSSNYPDQTDSRLISPAFELPTISGDERIELRFWHWFDYDGGDGDDKGRVQVSVWNGSAWGGWSTLAIPIDAHEGHPSERTYNSGWSRCAVELTPYAGQQVRLAFYHVASSGDDFDNSRSGWYIDDVELWHGVPQMPEFEGFENGWGDWHADQGVWQVGNPTSGPGSAHEGTSVAATALGGNYPSQTDSYLVSPHFEVPIVAGDEMAVVYFWHWYSYAELDSGTLRVSTYDTDNASWGSWVDLNNFSGSSGGWRLVTIDLSLYSGKRIKLGFSHTARRTNSYDGESTGWYIDDIQILLGTSDDIDGDGLPNTWETEQGLDPNDPDDALYDGDNDGLDNLGEYEQGTDPNDPDSDNDTLPDGWEVRYGIDPMDDGSGDPSNGCDGDIDGDGLTNCQEYEYGLDPTVMEKGELDLPEGEMVVSIGGSRGYELLIANTKAVPDTYELTITGLDPDWYDFSETTLFLMAGEEKTVELTLHIPADCGISEGAYPFSVSATSENTLLTTSLEALLTVVRDPLLSNLVPEDSEAMGANRLLISWQSDAPGSTEVFYRKKGATTFNSAAGAAGTTHEVTLEDLDWNSEYEWYALTATACGSAQTELRSNAIQEGVVFEGEPYAFTIERDYDQIRTISVRNTDIHPHEILLTIINYNEDLIAGFRGDGSMDQTITLQPGEARTVEVAFHAQDAEQETYKVKFKLRADMETSHPIVNYAYAMVTVNQPEFDLVLEELDANPQTLVNTFRLTNNGDVLTDVSVTADEESRPALMFNPVIEHLRMETGESVEFTVSADRGLTAILTAKGMDREVTLETMFGCAPGTQLYTILIENPRICRKVRSWYCTNRPRLNIPFTLPQGLKETSVLRAALLTDFSVRPNWRYYPHDVSVLVNRNPVLNLNDTIPNGRYVSSFPPSFLHYSTTGPAANAIQVNTQHLNGGHYVIVSDFTVVLELKESMPVVVCAASQEEAEVLAQQKAADYSCDIEWDTCPYVLGADTLNADTGAPDSHFYYGDKVTFDVKMMNPDAVEHIMYLKIALDSDLEDDVPPVLSYRKVSIPAYSYITKQHTVTVPYQLGYGKVYASYSLTDGECSTDKPYAYAFTIDEAPAPVAWITDGGLFSTDNTTIFADWGATAPYSQVAYYVYRIGTSPCLGDVQDWTESAVSGPRNIPVSLTYDRTYYVCVKAVNAFGTESDPVSTDGIAVLDPLGDPDEDTYVTQEELDAQSDPLNAPSIPGESVLHLYRGFNLVSYPGEVLFYGTLQNLLNGMGGPEVIDRVKLFDPASQSFTEAGFDEDGHFYGHDTALLPGTGLDGMIVYAKQDHTVIYTSRYCRTWSLPSGTSLTGTGCIEPGLTAVGLLQAFGPENAVSIQRYNTATGKFETVGFDAEGQAVGIDFPIVAGEGYFVNMK